MGDHQGRRAGGPAGGPWAGRVARRNGERPRLKGHSMNKSEAAGLDRLWLIAVQSTSGSTSVVTVTGKSTVQSVARAWYCPRAMHRRMHGD
jgi:hypothetical protein